MRGGIGAALVVEEIAEADAAVPPDKPGWQLSVVEGTLAGRTSVRRQVADKFELIVVGAIVVVRSGPASCENDRHGT